MDSLSVSNMRDEDRRKREEAQLYAMQQQIDEMKRLLRESAARQQWLEDNLKQSEGRGLQNQIATEKLIQELQQSLQVRQMEEQRVRKAISELEGQIDEPIKPLKEMRAQITELGERIRSSQGQATVSLQQLETVQTHLRDLQAQIAVQTDQHKQNVVAIRDNTAAVTENRQEIVRLVDSQRVEEQRLRRQDVEIQQYIEQVRGEVSQQVARITQLEETRKQFVEEIDALATSLTTTHTEYTRLEDAIVRANRDNSDRYLSQQERLEVVRTQLEADLGDLRQVSEQRVERILSRQQSLDDRIRQLEADLSLVPGQIEALRQHDDLYAEEAETLYEQHLLRAAELAEQQLQLYQHEKRRSNEQAAPSPAPASGSLVRRARDARPPQDEGDWGADE